MRFLKNKVFLAISAVIWALFGGVALLAVWVNGGGGHNEEAFVPKQLDPTPFRTYEAQVAGSRLRLKHFVSELNEINVSSSMIMGEKEMVLVATQATKLSAARLADEIEKTGLKLTTVYLGHAHLDHSQGAAILQQRFPEAVFLAAPEVARLQQFRMTADDERARNRYGKYAAVPSVPFQPLDADKLILEGHEIHLWHDQYGDVGIGHADEPHTVVYVPDLKALLGNDILYYDAHMMMGGSTPANREKWKAQIRQWMTMDLAVAIPGHVPRRSTAHMTAQGVLEHSLNYIENYERALAQYDSAEGVIDHMLRLYPGMEHRSALYLGTYIQYRDTHKLLFNPRLETVAGLLPDSVVRWFDDMTFDAAKKAANPH